MTDARQKLEALNHSIATAAFLIKAEVSTIEQFLKELHYMENVGPVLEPTLFRSSERQVISACFKPVYEAALHLVRVYDIQVEAAKAALEKVKSP
jgi:hypothetical protein